MEWYEVKWTLVTVLVSVIVSGEAIVPDAARPNIVYCLSDNGAAHVRHPVALLFRHPTALS